MNKRYKLVWVVDHYIGNLWQQLPQIARCCYYYCCPSRFFFFPKKIFNIWPAGITRTQTISTKEWQCSILHPKLLKEGNRRVFYLFLGLKPQPESTSAMHDQCRKHPSAPFRVCSKTNWDPKPIISKPKTTSWERDDLVVRIGISVETSGNVGSSRLAGSLPSGKRLKSRAPCVVRFACKRERSWPHCCCCGGRIGELGSIVEVPRRGVAWALALAMDTAVMAQLPYPDRFYAAASFAGFSSSSTSSSSSSPASASGRSV